MSLDVAAVTNLGLVRARNEDHAVVDAAIVHGDDDHFHGTVDPPVVLAVLDGMGGHPAGDVASGLVARVLAQRAADALRTPDEIAVLMADLDRRLAAHMDDNPATRTMGTTIVGAIVHAPDRALVFAVGDSLALWWAEDDLDVVFPPDRSAWGGITQVLGGSLGPDDALAPHVMEVRGPGRLVLTSDGLTDLVDGATAATALALDDLVACTNRLVELALDAGGVDNVTVVAVDLVAAD